MNKMGMTKTSCLSYDVILPKKTRMVVTNECLDFPGWKRMMVIVVMAVMMMMMMMLMMLMLMLVLMLMVVVVVIVMESSYHSRRHGAEMCFRSFCESSCNSSYVRSSALAVSPIMPRV